MKSYYNTTCSSGSDLSDYLAKAVKQETAILSFFRINPNTAFSPSEVHLFMLPDAPITSIRRAMTNLTDQGRLIKTDVQKTGPFKRPEYLWILSTE